MMLRILIIFTLICGNGAEWSDKTTSQDLSEVGTQIDEFLGNVEKMIRNRNLEREGRAQIETLVNDRMIPLLESHVKDGDVGHTSNTFLNSIQLIRMEVSGLQRDELLKFGDFLKAAQSLTSSVHPEAETVYNLMLENIFLYPPSWGTVMVQSNKKLKKFIAEPEVLENVIGQIKDVKKNVVKLQRVYKEKEECEHGYCKNEEDMNALISMGIERAGPVLEKLMPLQAKVMFLINQDAENIQKVNALKTLEFQKNAREKIEVIAIQLHKLRQFELGKNLKEFIKESLNFELVAPKIGPKT